MDRLASSIDRMRPSYDVVVVGSGYGGSVMAARLAEAGRRVCVLERGDERHPGEYPETLSDVLRDVQLTTGRRHLGPARGLFDLRVGGPMNVLVGCGLGGTSLINAGVALRVPPDLVDGAWPASIERLGRTGLDPFYERAAAVLGATTYPGARLNKLAALERCAAGLGGTAERAPVNVTFRARRNPWGIDQPSCTGCGNCITGCNVGAKNTLLMNYLPAARDAGAEIFVRAAVRHVARADDGGWEVSVAAGDPRGTRTGVRVVRARQVVLAGGTLGSTEILLRSRRRGLSLSGALGRSVNGNGDILAFAFDGARPVDAIVSGPPRAGDTPLGPTIVGRIDLTGAEAPDHRLLVEDASVPPALGRAIPPLLAALSLRHHPMRALVALASPATGALRRTLPLAVMSADGLSCDLELVGDLVRTVRRPAVGDDAGHLLWPRHKKQLHAAARALGAAPVHLPHSVPGMGSPLITVHPLGGCAMADSAERGVVNDAGEVFAGRHGEDVHQGLFVVDGSVVPRPVVANPLLTIAALAERTAELMTGAR